MRPVSLRIEGFTCFKREQVVDFDGLDLFAISGQTGAGKSSLLDAMVYALYGRIPRIGKRGYTEFISLGATRMSVRFDFAVGERRYRVTRTARRVGAPSAQIEEVTAEGETVRALADGIASVDKVTVEIVGLDYDAFVQAVVLPQGEFAKFLKSNPGERTRLLRELLRLMRYEDMRQIAQTKSKTAASEASHIEKRLAEDYSRATPVEVGRLENKIAEGERALTDLRNKLADSDLEIKRARRIRERTAALESKQGERRGVFASKEDMTKKRSQIAAAVKAAAVAPLLEKVHENRARTERATEERATAEGNLRTAVRDETKALATYEAAKEGVKRIPAIEKTIQQLGEAVGLLEPKRRAEQNVRRLEEEEGVTQKRIADLAKQHGQGATRVATAVKTVSTAERELQRIGYQADFHEKIEGVLEDARALVNLRVAAEEARAEAGTAELEADNAKKEAESAARRVDPSARAVEKATRAAVQASRRLGDAERAHGADHLRSHLRAGEPCPVCEQQVLNVPKARKVSVHLDQLRSAAEEARSQAARVQERHTELLSDSRSLARAATAAEKKSEKAADQSKKNAAAYDSARKRLETWARRTKLEIAEPVEDHLLNLDRELRVKRKNHVGALEAVRVATKSRDDAMRDQEKIDSQSSAVRAQLARIAEQLADAKEELNDYAVKIRRVSGEDDPREAREAMQAERTRLEDANDEARLAATSASQAVAMCQARVTTAKEQVSAVTVELQAAHDKASKAVRGAGFADEAAARAALLEEMVTRRLEREVREFDNKLSVLDARIAELERELDGQLLSQGELDLKERERNELAAQVESDAGGLGVVKADLQQLRDQLLKSQELASQLEGYQQTARVYGSLADELQSNRFQQYLLDETVGELVAGASERLKKISDRYALVLREGEFYVVDHDNAGEQRSADTLSGGETFLTSLALALELSTRVQDAAGAVRLESIFIDEGFGTLDADTLDTVAGAIEALPVGGRMVGIITHIAELTERMPGRITIEAGADGSRVSVRTQ